MFSFLETICINNGQAQHVDYHQMRVNETFDSFFPEWEPFDVSEEIDKVDLPKEGIHRLRITYTEDPQRIELLPYEAKIVHTFALVDSGEIDYGFKWAERGFFQHILEAHPEADEVIFHKDGIIQDCTMANLAFLKDGIWYTPEAPLHWGTTRARLLVEDQVEETDILVSELDQYERICLINVFRPLSFEKSIALRGAIV
ncbi:MAG: Aminodeoxychorismate lyase [Bacteroidota bacterium]|jgi:4-amino-4-deoxychorismate lyase